MAATGSTCFALALVLLQLRALAAADHAPDARGPRSPSARRGLPEGPVIVGYQDWSACNLSKTLEEVESGVNVVIWFATNLARDKTTRELAIQGGPNYTCVAEVRAAIEARGLPTAHLISIGGWDAPHPDSSASGSAWFAAWSAWNAALPRPFDGFDWDLEGNDKPDSPYNEFAPEVLQIIVDMSVAAKAAGFVVTMVPAQSYLDVDTGGFDRSLRHAYADWHPDFHYHGLNCQAYVLAAAPADTFDLVTVQLYETWSRAGQALLQAGLKPEQYLQDWVAKGLVGWTVNFTDPALPLRGERQVKIQQHQLVVGMAFGSDDGSGKSAFFWPSAAGSAYESAPAALRPRGYAFWNIAMDGSLANGTGTAVDFARGLNAFLGIRPSTSASGAGLIVV